jgi:hypothetical protein
LKLEEKVNLGLEDRAHDQVEGPDGEMSKAEVPGLEVETVDTSRLENQDVGTPSAIPSMLEGAVKVAKKQSAGLKKALWSPSYLAMEAVEPSGKVEQRPVSKQRGVAKMTVICRIPETLYE